MNLELNHDALCLKPKQALKVHGGLGHSIVCHTGSVWVTQEGDPRDIILDAGESFTLDCAGLALVLAFEPSSVSIARPQAGATRLAVFLRSALSDAGPARSVFGI